MLTKDEHAELFIMSLNGVIADAFIRAGISPTHEQWEMLRSKKDKDITIRELSDLLGSVGLRAVIDIKGPADA